MLIWQLVQLAVWRSGKFKPDKIFQIERWRGGVFAFARHEIGQCNRVRVAEVRTDQIRIVDVHVVNVFTRLHLRLDFFDHIAFLNNVVGQFDTRNF